MFPLFKVLTLNCPIALIFVVVVFCFLLSGSFQTSCQQELDQVLERISTMRLPDERGPLEHLYSLHIPNCDKHGFYNLKQVSEERQSSRAGCTPGHSPRLSMRSHHVQPQRAHSSGLMLHMRCEVWGKQQIGYMTGLVTPCMHLHV